MIELADWLWLGVLALWLLFRVVPRLFRGRVREAPPARPRPTPPVSRPAPPEMPEADEHGQPPPIEPR